jgi:hypothetical protein
LGGSGGDISTAGIAAAVIVPLVLVLAAIAAIVVVLLVRRSSASGRVSTLRRRTASVSGSSPLYDYNVDKRETSLSPIVNVMHNDIYLPTAEGFHAL